MMQVIVSVQEIEVGLSMMIHSLEQTMDLYLGLYMEVHLQ